VKRKIAIIIQKLHGGGAERAASNLSIFLSEFYEVHVIVFDGSNAKYPVGGTLHDLKRKPSKFKIFTAVKRIFDIKKIKKEHNIECTISFMDNANIANVFSRQNDRVVVSIRNNMSVCSQYVKEMRTMFKIGFSLIKRKADIIVAVAEGVREDLIENYNVTPDKVVTVCNFCDNKLLMNLASLNREAASSMAENSLITMGRLTEQKGQWHLLRAMPKVIESVPDAVLYILGEGPLEKELKELARELKIENSVKFLGYVEAPHAFVANSKVFVLPSLLEGMSNVLLEAMAFGTPCIATDCHSGSRDVIAGCGKTLEKLDELEYAEYGILTSVCVSEQKNAFEPLTKEELQLAEAIVKLLIDGGLSAHYHKKALERSEAFSPKTITKLWYDLIEGICR